jgi:uncharacterized protein (TIGR03435 family)
VQSKLLQQHLRQRLGLKLETQRDQVEIIVIERVEKPSEN